ncbi:MAG: FAD-dependent oxidoreductase [Frankia sp.]
MRDVRSVGRGPATEFTRRSWPLVVVGGGPGAARQLARSVAPPAETLLIADRLGGGMEMLGSSRLQSYGEELWLGGARDALRRRLGALDLQPTGRQFTDYVADHLRESAVPVMGGEVLDVRSDGDDLAVVVRPAGSGAGAQVLVHARAVVLATGVSPRPPSAAWSAAGAVTFDQAYQELEAGLTARYAGRSVMVVGSGNSAMQTAALVSRLAEDTLVLAKRYHGMYPQETDDRFAWRSWSQLTCEMITKSADRCAQDPGTVPCVRMLVYDRLDLAAGRTAHIRYRAGANRNVLGAASLPGRCGHAHGYPLARSGGDVTWLEKRDLARTAVIWATGVHPRYPPGPALASLPHDDDGYLIVNARGATALPGLYVTGACAGSRAVNEMWSADVDTTPEPGHPVCAAELAARR